MLYLRVLDHPAETLSLRSETSFTDNKYLTPSYPTPTKGDMSSRKRSAKPKLITGQAPIVAISTASCAARPFLHAD